MIPKDDMTTEEQQAAEAYIRSVHKTCRGYLPKKAREEVAAAFAEGEESLARHLDRENRGGCGADINEVVAAGPWDGEEHEAPCPDPDCEVIISYIPLTFDRELLDQLTEGS